MSSSAIRSQIEICRRRLKDAIDESTNIEDVSAAKDDSSEDVYSTISAITDTIYRIEIEVSRIKKCNVEWRQLINQQPAEAAIKEDYKKRVGHYETELVKAEGTAVRLKTVYEEYAALHRNKSTESTAYPQVINVSPHTPPSTPMLSMRLPTSLPATTQQPPVPMLSLQVHQATFIQAYTRGAWVPNWTAYTFAQHAAPGRPTKGLVGELQCNSLSNAIRFNCYFDRSLCHCNGFSTQVNCQCSTTKMADYGLQNKLPTERLNHKVFTLSGTPHVVTSASQETLINLHVEMVNVTVSRITEILSCYAEQIGELSGCHSCYSGASVKINCRSRKHMSGLLHCQHHFETTINCSL
ncbi:unnamed protein product [Caenorhabditis sp. 36 PRJEB53466]|nr:unnamed protein product [Caenorhabditis sp. 36 PRJEB53466]